MRAILLLSSSISSVTLEDISCLFVGMVLAYVQLQGLVQVLLSNQSTVRLHTSSF